MEVWRVENSEGYGPYQGLTETSWTKDKRAFNHPGPTEDEKLSSPWHILCNGSEKELDHWVFGFESENQMLEWFTHCELDRLCELGFYVTKIEVDEILIIKGSKQIIFRRDKRTPARIDYGEITF